MSEARAAGESDLWSGSVTPEGVTVLPPVKTSGDLSSPRRLKRLLVATDLGSALLAWTIAVVVASQGVLGDGGLRDWLDAGSVIVAVSLATMGVLAASRLYLARVCAVRAVETARLLRAAVGGAATLALVTTWLGWPLDVAAIVLGAVGAFAFLWAGRAVYRSWILGRRRRGALLRPVVMVGANEEARDLWRLVGDHPEHGFKIVGVVGPRGQAELLLGDVPWLGHTQDAFQAVRMAGASGAMVAASALDPEELNVVARRLMDAGVHVQLSSGLRGISHHRLRAAPIAHEPLFYLEQPKFSPLQRRVKRALDVTLAGVGLVLISPLLASVAVAVRRHDGGPVLFRQRRVGLEGRHFMVLKFRTMTPDAEGQLEALREDNQRAGPLFKLAQDPRVTPVGRVLRATSMDELPQLLNVLRGEMSLVGPRPALPAEVEHFDERLQERAQVMPGITGLWQVEARDKPSFWAYQRLDLFYVENWSVGLDLSILAATAGVVIGRSRQALRTSVPAAHEAESPPPLTVLE